MCIDISLVISQKELLNNKSSCWWFEMRDDVSFVISLNELLNKQSSCWWFETTLHSITQISANWCDFPIFWYIHSGENPTQAMTRRQLLKYCVGVELSIIHPHRSHDSPRSRPPHYLPQLNIPQLPVEQDAQFFMDVLGQYHCFAHLINTPSAVRFCQISSTIFN